LSVLEKPDCETSKKFKTIVERLENYRTVETSKYRVIVERFRENYGL
jgi:hypothetical protein